LKTDQPETIPFPFSQNNSLCIVTPRSILSSRE